AKAQCLFNLVRFQPGYLPRIGEIIGDEAASDFFTSLADNTYRIAACKVSLNPANAGWQQALAASQGAGGAGVDDQPAHRNECAGDPSLARLKRRRFCQKPCAALSPGDTLQGVALMTGGDHHIATGGKGDLRRFELGYH